MPLNRYESFLREWILEGHKTIGNQMFTDKVKSWVDGGLEPRAVTRDLDWGIDVPVEGAEGKNYMFGLMRQLVTFLQPKNGQLMKEKIGNRIGKMPIQNWFTSLEKIISFSIASFFPAMLKAEGSYILPDNVPANEFLNLEGNKLSTSKNWAVWLHEYLQISQKNKIRCVMR